MPKTQLGVSAVTSSVAASPAQLAAGPSLFWGCHQEKAACTSLLSFQGTLGALPSIPTQQGQGKGPQAQGKLCQQWLTHSGCPLGKKMLQKWEKEGMLILWLLKS